jgi:hypothetical protein
MASNACSIKDYGGPFYEGGVSGAAGGGATVSAFSNGTTTGNYVGFGGGAIVSGYGGKTWTIVHCFAGC